jgi:hypothetical protein
VPMGASDTSVASSKKDKARPASQATTTDAEGFSHCGKCGGRIPEHSASAPSMQSSVTQGGPGGEGGKKGVGECGSCGGRVIQSSAYCRHCGGRVPGGDGDDDKASVSIAPDRRASALFVYTCVCE